MFHPQGCEAKLMHDATQVLRQEHEVMLGALEATEQAAAEARRAAHVANSNVTPDASQAPPKK